MIKTYIKNLYHLHFAGHYYDYNLHQSFEGVIQGRARTNNLLGDLVLLERDNKNTLSVEGVELIMTDIMATNGVIHVVNDVIIPSAAKRLSDLLKERKLTKLLTMLESAKLVRILKICL